MTPRTKVALLAPLALGLSLALATSIAAQQLSPQDHLPPDATVRFLVTGEHAGWRLGRVGSTTSPRCTLVDPGSDPLYYLAALDSLQVRIVAGSDTTWRPVDMTGIMAREQGCPRPRFRDTSTVKPSNPRQQRAGAAP